MYASSDRTLNNDPNTRTSVNWQFQGMLEVRRSLERIQSRKKKYRVSNQMSHNNIFNHWHVTLCQGALRVLPGAILLKHQWAVCRYWDFTQSDCVGIRLTLRLHTSSEMSLCQYFLGSYKVHIKDFEGSLLLFHLFYTKQNSLSKFEW